MTPEHPYRLLFENNPLPMWVFDTETYRFLMVNHAAIELYGYSEQEFLQKSIMDIRPKEELAALEEVLNKGRTAYNRAGEWVHTTKDGKRLYVEVASHTLPEHEGRGRRLVVIHDLSARKRTEQQLQAAELLAQSILKNIEEIVFTLNEELEPVYVSPQCESNLGYSPEEFYQDKGLWFKIIHPEDRQIFKRFLPRLKSTPNHFQVECRFLTANKGERWQLIQCAATLDQNGRISRLDGSLIDISKRKAAEQKLQFSDFSVERAAEAFLWTRADGSIMRANAAACSLLGYTKEELLTLSILEVDHNFKAEVWKWKENDKALSHETVFKGKSGQLLPVELHLNHFLFEDDNYCFISVKDISARKQAEEERNSLIEETVRQNEHLQQFAYIVSHNLRAPVANIVGLTSLYNRDNLQDPINPVLINKLERTSQRLDATIKDLNEILTIRSQTQKVLETVDLQHILAHVRESLASQLQSSHAYFEVDFSGGTLVLGVKSYVHSILFNLITNAIKYRSLERGLKIKIKTVFSEGYLCLLLQDNGLGIDMVRQQHKVFGLYRRFHPHIEGKGLGLHMSKTQVESIGGWIDVDSTVDQGSTFKVYFQAHPRNEQLSSGISN
ncbi:PAS domain S-box protein [Nibribacter ruber]|uniref:histidine kinase n=1 Tax=Nibribacter ruber TaxID=2698458 RepID=A0A6P1NUY9_9BACT|nr:PAS domain S-box protein [Nibribacter ruber]QHL86870.1 PAS domain S-box protein [Nibribacter ruber]